MLKVEKIDVFYGSMQALWDLSFEVKKGEICVLVGSNGAGKSTLLNTISSIIKPRKGVIKLEGKRIDSVPPHHVVRLGVVHIPEGRHLFPYMTVLENIKIGFHKSGKSKADQNRSIDRIYELFPNLREREKQLALSLSGGEQQMLTVARGLALSPKLMLLDEPSLGLSPLIVEQLFKIIRVINQEGITIALVEQNVEYSLNIAESAYILENGRITLTGKGKDLLENEFVKKSYLGM